VQELVLDNSVFVTEFEAGRFAIKSPINLSSGCGSSCDSTLASLGEASLDPGFFSLPNIVGQTG
jgi:hypothetical protein